MSRAGRWSKTVGGYGHRVEVYERSPGRLSLRYWDATAQRMRRAALGHGDRDRAVAQAKQISSELLAGTIAAKTGRLTVADLFARYAAGVTEHRSRTQAAEARRRADLWRAWLGPERDVKSIDFSIVDGFVRARRAGKIKVAGRALSRSPGETTIGHDVLFLVRALNWAVKTRSSGKPLLSDNPIRGYQIPVTAFPKRPVASYDRFCALIGVAGEVDSQGLFGSFLELVEGLGWRVGAICRLRAADLDRASRPDAPWGRLRKRGEYDKTRVDQQIPVSEPVRQAIDRAISRSGAVGDGWVFPSPRNPGAPWSRFHARDLLERAERVAGLEHLDQGGFHAYRRKWATERKHLPLQDVAAAGGWKDLRTLETIYQQADTATLLAVVTEPRKLREAK